MPLGKREKGLGIEKGISCRVCCYNVTLWDLQKHLIFLHKSESFFQLFLLLIKKKKATLSYRNEVLTDGRVKEVRGYVELQLSE